MINPIQWFKEKGFTFDDKITIKDLIDLQEDARKFPPLPIIMGQRITREEVIEGLRDCLANMVKLEREKDLTLRGYPDAVTVLDYIEEHGLEPKRQSSGCKEEWRCFHCDEVFTDRESAENHFGASVACAPMCQIFGKTVRAMEDQLRSYQNEDTDLHRRIASMQTEHQQALMRAEESGYAKGLRDGCKEIPPGGSR